jgi:hypothetical protein
LGIKLQLLIGPIIATPAPASITEAIKSIEVTNSDSGRSGFQITFTLGRGGGGDTSDYSLFNTSSLLRPFTRVIIIVNIGITRKVLFDGFITHYQFSPSDSPGASTFTVTGEDYSIIMDRIEFSMPHPAQPDVIIVGKILLQHGLIPRVIPPLQMVVPIPVKETPLQIGTDLEYIQQLARKYNYVFYVEPTDDDPGMNIAYWGPSIRVGDVQKALTVNMGAATNATSINVQNNALEPKMVVGFIQDENAQNIPIPIVVPIPLPPYLASRPAHIFNQPFVKKTLPSSDGEHNVLGAYIRAMGDVDSSKDVMSVSGEVDTLRYGNILRARRLVSLRGVGTTHDGLYYVKSVTHKIERGTYKQSFTLVREGNGSIIAGVNP